MSCLRRNLKSPVSGRDVDLYLCMMRAACQAQSLKGALRALLCDTLVKARSLFEPLEPTA